MRGRLRSLIVVCGALVAAAAMAGGRRRLDVVAVRGSSMAPSLLPGDRLLVVRLGRPARVGEVVLAPDPRLPERELVKRVVASRGGAVAVRGDAPYASTDSRTFGTLPAGAVRWRAAARYWPARRAGRIPPAPERLPLADVVEGGEPACAVPDALIVGDPD
jgi:nickel-type superoxide dismutase maturation protease